MFTVFLDGHGNGHGLLLVPSIQCVKANQLRLAEGQRAGLVKDHGVDLVGQLQGLGVADQNAVFGCYAGADHDGCRGRQAQRTGAGNHQYGNGIQQGLFAAKPEAADGPAKQGNHHDHRYKNRTDTVNQALDRCLGGLRTFHQTNDTREHGVMPHGEGFDYQQSVQIH